MGGDKNTRRVSEAKRGEGRSRKTFGRHLNTNARESAKRTKRDKYELRLATQHLLHGFQVPEVRLCARKTFPARGAIQLIKKMERNVKGYKEVRRGLTEARELVARQKRDRQSMDRPVVTSYYKSPVGTRSSKGSGAVFYSDPVERSYFFSGVKKI